MFNKLKQVFAGKTPPSPGLGAEEQQSPATGSSNLNSPVNDRISPAQPSTTRPGLTSSPLSLQSADQPHTGATRSVTISNQPPIAINPSPIRTSAMTVPGASPNSSHPIAAPARRPSNVALVGVEVNHSPNRLLDSDDEASSPVSQSCPVVSRRWISEMPRKPILRPSAAPMGLNLPPMDLPPSLPDNFQGPFLRQMEEEELLTANDLLNMQPVAASCPAAFRLTFIAAQDDGSRLVPHHSAVIADSNKLSVTVDAPVSESPLIFDVLSSLSSHSQFRSMLKNVHQNNAQRQAADGTIASTLEIPDDKPVHAEENKNNANTNNTRGPTRRDPIAEENAVGAEGALSFNDDPLTGADDETPGLEL